MSPAQNDFDATDPEAIEVSDNLERSEVSQPAEGCNLSFSTKCSQFFGSRHVRTWRDLANFSRFSPQQNKDDAAVGKQQKASVGTNPAGILGPECSQMLCSVGTSRATSAAKGWDHARSRSRRSPPHTHPPADGFSILLFL